MPNAESIVSEPLEARAPEIIERVVDSHFAANPTLEKRYGNAGKEKCRADTGSTLRHLSSAVAYNNPILFADYITWLRSVLAGYDIPVGDIVASLGHLSQAINDILPQASANAAQQIIHHGLGVLDQQVSEPDSFVAEFDTAVQYVDKLLGGKRHDAFNLIHEAVEADMSVKDVYLRILQPSQWEIGRLWQLNKITVAQEHYCTAATQLLMAQLYPKILELAEANACHHSLVMTCVGGDLHEVGARLVSDFFEMAGWNSVYLGANTPTRDVVAMVEERNVGLLAVSATLPYHLKAVEDLIATVRKNSSLEDLPIIVGGRPFNMSPNLFEDIGANATAADGQKAIEAARSLIKL